MNAQILVFKDMIIIEETFTCLYYISVTVAHLEFQLSANASVCRKCMVYQRSCINAILLMNEKHVKTHENQAIQKLC